MKGRKAAKVLRERAEALRKLVREQMRGDEPELAEDLSHAADDLDARAERLERIGRE
jgi:hypothetical protein